MTPPLTYTGPSRTRRVVEQLYRKFASEFDRDNPSFVVGLPGVETTRFETQEKLMRFIDKTLIDLFGTVDDLRDGNGGAQEACDAAFAELKTTSLSHQGHHAVAMYRPVEDRIYLDPYLTIFFSLFGRGHRQFGTDIDISVRHEMVHFALGASDISMALREQSQRYDLFEPRAKVVAEYQQGSPSGHQIWQQMLKHDEEIGAYERRHGTHATLVYIVAENNGAVLEMQRIGKKLQQGGFGVLDEACAHAYCDTLHEFLSHLLNQGIREPLAHYVYEKVERKIGQQGRLETLKQVREAMDIAYREDRNALTVFSSI